MGLRRITVRPIAAVFGAEKEVATLDATRAGPGLMPSVRLGRVVRNTTLVRPVADVLVQETGADAGPAMERRDKVTPTADAFITALGAPSLGGVGVAQRPTKPGGAILEVQAATDPMASAVGSRTDVGIGARSAAGARTGAQVT